MAMTFSNGVATPAAMRVIHPLSIEAELTCLMCGRVVGDIVAGRAVHHAGCSGRLGVERGLIRCCKCGGPVSREPMMGLSSR
ncbi:MAG: hypothetical protein U0821_08095 [Chloroflexota bacterium]